MASVNVQGFGVVNFPEGMSEQAIAQAIERDIVPQIKAKREAAIAADPHAQDALAMQKPGAMARFGRGFMDIAQGAKQLALKVSGADNADAYSREIKSENEMYEKGRGPDAGFDWLRLGGNVAATAPVGTMRFAASAPKALQYLGITGQGASAAALNPVLDGGDEFLKEKAIQTGVGAAVAPVAAFGIQTGGEFLGNKVVRPARDFISATARRVSGEAPNPNAVLKPDGSLTDKGMAALKNLGLALDDLTDDVRGRLQQFAADSTKGKAMTPEQQLRASLFKEVTGEEATLGQVTREYGQQQSEHELKKSASVGGPLRQRFAKQNRGILGAVEDVRKGTGAAAPDEYSAGQAVSKSVRSADTEARQAVSALYKQIDEDLGGQFKIKPEGLLGKIDEISDNAEADPIVASVRRKLTRYGLLNDAGNLKRGASLNAKQAEELRKFVGGLSGDTPSKKRMLGQLVDTLDDDVRASAGEDVYEIARNTAKVRFEDLRIPAVRAIVDGDVRAEDVFDKFVRRGGIDDLKALKGYMSRGGEDAHGLTPAWNELRGQTLGHVFEQATKQSARNELDDVIFSGAMFRKALKDMGDEKLRVLFTPEEMAKLEKVAKVAEWRIPVADTVNTSNTSSAIWNMIDRVLSYLPGRSGMVARGAGRAARIGAEEIEQEVAAKAAMVPADTLAQQAKEAAKKKTSEVVREGAALFRGPSFFSLGAERKRGN